MKLFLRVAEAGILSKAARGELEALDEEVSKRECSPAGLVRVTSPPGFAAACLLPLASDESSFCTGTELRVDGGHAEL